jgi:hypothetical protein
MEYVRKVDFAAIAKIGANERLTQNLFDRTSGAKTCTIYLLRQDDRRRRLPGRYARPRGRSDLLHPKWHDEHRGRGKAV